MNYFIYKYCIFGLLYYFFGVQRKQITYLGICVIFTLYKDQHIYLYKLFILIQYVAQIFMYYLQRIHKHSNLSLLMAAETFN